MAKAEDKVISSVEADGLTPEQRAFIEQTDKEFKEMKNDPNVDQEAIENYNTETWKGKTEMHVPEDIPSR